MTVFIIIAVVLVVAGLCFLLPPLLQKGEVANTIGRDAINLSIYQDQLDELKNELSLGNITDEEFEKNTAELKRRMLEDANSSESTETEVVLGKNKQGKIAAFTILFMVPVITVALYGYLGRIELLDPVEKEAIAQEAGHSTEVPDVEKMVTALAEKLKEDPSNAQGWMMLGRSYFFMRRFSEAADAYGTAVALDDSDPNLLVYYADALAMTNNGSFTEQSLTLVKRALEIAPNHEQGLWMAGTAAFESTDYASALNYWTRLSKMVDPESETGQVMAGNIIQARRLMGDDAPVMNDLAAVPSTSKTVNAEAKITGRVSLNKKYWSEIDINDTVFVFAKATSGPPMPLAVVKAKVGDLPLEFSLDDSMAMMPQMKLSNFDKVLVSARISKSGDARAQSGDIESPRATVAIGAVGINIEIDRVVP